MADSPHARGQARGQIAQTRDQSDQTRGQVGSVGSDRPTGSIGSVGSILLGVGVFDGAIVLGMMLGWPILGALDMGLFFALVALRSVLCFVHLWSLLGPLRARSGPHGQLADVQLTALDASLQHLPRRFALAYGASWAVAPVLALLGSGIEGPFMVAQARAELVASALLITGSTTVITAFMLTVCRAALDPAVIEISREIVARKLSVDRPSTSFKRELLINILAVVFAGFTTFAGLVGKVRVDAVREAAAARALAAAELGAIRLETGRDNDEPVRVVGIDALPPVLTEQLRANGRPAVVFEHARERVVAAAAVEGRGFVVVEEVPEEQLLISVILLLSICGGVLFGTSLSIRALGASLTSPLAELSEAARRMVERGEIRGLPRAVPRRNNELGALMGSFNHLLDMLDELTEAAEAVAGGDLRVELARPGELHDAFGVMVDQLHAMVDRIRGTALEVSSATAEIHASTQEHERLAHSQTEAVNELSAMLGSLANAAGSVTDFAHGVLGDTERSLATSDRVAAEIEAFDGQASGIAVLLDGIREVADRSDLLALNGSLEAIRAGEAGRGFGLVASEMRRLAERVTGLVSSVRDQLDELDRTKANTVTATEQNRALAQGTTVAAERISSVTRKQGEDTAQASASAQRIAESVVVAAAGISQTRAACGGLQVHVGELERLTRQFKLREHELQRE